MNAPKKKILIVDDDRTTASVMKLYLKEFDYKVSGIATNGIEAIEMTRKLEPHLVLMDIRLGKGMDGIDAAEIINKHFGTPIVYVTAYAEDATLERAKLTEPAGYINKPLRDKDLRTTIEIVLSKFTKPYIGQNKKSGKTIEEILMNIYKLTPAEARVVTELLEYPQLRNAAKDLNISMLTAKTHLKHIYRKTNTNRLSIMLHRIISGPAGLVMNKLNSIQ